MQCVYNRMATMSKLKRKKSAIEESRCEQQSRIKKSNDSPSEAQDSSCRTTSNVTGRARWWESSELSDAERLWALTLRAFCPALQSDQEQCIPQLPPPSSTKTCVQKVSDWRWCGADEDGNPPRDLPAPSFLTTPPQVNDFSAPSQTPAAENKGEPPPAIGDQENDASTPDQDGVSVCDERTAQPHHLEVNCIELSDEQSDKFDQVGKVSETQEVKRGSGAGLDVESGAGKRAKTGAGGSGSWLRTTSEAEGSVSGMGTKQGAGGSGSGKKAKSGVKRSGLALGAKSGAGLDAKSGPGKGAKTWLRTISSSMGTKQGVDTSGLGQRAKSGLVGFESVLVANSGLSESELEQGTKSRSHLGTKSVADGSGSGLGTKSGAGLNTESGPGKVVKTDAGGSGSQLRTISEAVSSMAIKQGAGGSGSWQIAKSGLGGTSGASGSGLGQGTKSGLDLGTNSEGSGAASGSGLGAKSEAEGSGAASGLGLGAKSGAEGSGAASGLGLGTKSGAEGSGAASGLGLGAKSGAEGSAAASRSELECCPMCLMPFPAGFTQMDCDGHLAQCLSEMHEDVIW